MLGKGMWLNREKLVFLGTVACLTGVGSYSVVSEPGRSITGMHRMARPVPEKISISLETRFSGAPSGPNPFAPYVDRAPRISPKPPVNPPVGPKPPVVNKHPRPPKPPIPPKPPTPTPTVPRPTTPRPYEVPVNFKGVVGIGDSKLYVLLKTKNSLENRYLSEGDIWPETGLRVVRITRSSVLLQNDKGERFLMRDLYAKKPPPEDGTGP